ncbi:flowering time control protein FPA [Primulina tabacum]|uniref:flowering time control protein FPA n=1 Tax=Primulina tabacum TaxID=48773 RepID=UPI003F59A7F1
MGSREGRGRPQRDYLTRTEEKISHGRGNNPPSRHLWVGNISHNLNESALVHHFLQFGKLESVAFQPGRSYAFINYRNDEDAFSAIKVLQDYVVEGNPLRIEFAKAEKSSTAQRVADYSQRREEPHPVARGSPFTSRDYRARNSSPEPPYPNKSRINDKDAELSEVLWIGFPAQLKVDEFILRKAFSPFGEIEKITAFPGRTYAFVRYRTVVAARRAKENLQGKLFGNPRVHICFAKNESGPPNRERISINAPPSPRAGSYGRPGSPEHRRADRNFGGMSGDPRISSPLFIRNLDPGNHDAVGLSRNSNIWHGRNDAQEQRRFPVQLSELGLPRNIYDHPNSPPKDIRANFREISPQKFSRQGPFYDDQWDFPEDDSILRGTKKVKTDSFSPENELPEYPFSELDRVKRVIPHDISQSRVLDFDSRQPGYRTIPDHLTNAGQPLRERSDRWNASLNNIQGGSVPLPTPDPRRSTPDIRKSSAKEVWKWEGMIVKGGTSVCRARCFPVGKPMDMGLPEYLDCTARTSLDMLGKHYYQAANAWVVFFVPAHDPDIPYYNEFMNYLAEKHRAAVAKLDERTTLFLVPPSEFSEKVLKVPGKLSISGVVLRLDPNNSEYGYLPRQEYKESNFTSFQSDEIYQKSISSPNLPFTNYEKPGIRLAPSSGNTFSGNMPGTFPGAAHSMSSIQSANTQGQDYAGKPAPGPNWAPHDLQNSNLSISNIPSHAFDSSSGFVGGTYSPMPRAMPEATQKEYTNDISGIPSSGNGKFPVPVSGLPAEQLAQLTSSLLGQQGQLGGSSTAAEYKPSGNINQSGYPQTESQNHGLPIELMSAEYLQSQFSQVQQQPPPANFLAAPQNEAQLQNAGQDDEEADPQKRLQATLQLAAALLQQIQQGKGT